MNNKNRFYTIISYVLCLVALVSLIPVLYVGRYDFATGDDYAYGALAHVAYMHTGSIWNAIKGAIQHTIDIYYSWQGTWLSVFLFCLHPEVFNDHAYFIVPWIMIGITVISIAVLSKYFLGRILKLSTNYRMIIFILTSILLVHFVPVKANSFYWYNGAIHYTVPFVLMTFSLVSGCRYILTGSKKDFIILCVLFTALGGMSYLAALAAPVGVLFIYLYLIISSKRKPIKKDLWLILPYGLIMTGLIISALSPGNKARGGEEFTLSVSRAFLTVFKAFVQSMQTAVSFIIETPYMILILLCIGIVFYEATKANYQDEIHSEKDYFKHPLIVILMVIIWNASVYAPELYSGVSVSEGVENTYFWILCMSLIIIEIYVLGYLKQKLLNKESTQITLIKGNADKEKKAMMIRIVTWCLIAFMGLAFYHRLADTTFKVCLDYIRKGYGEDFREQMLLQQELLSTDERDVVLPATNAYEGPIFNMPVSDEADAWTNGAVARFYDKDSVIGMDADTWHSRMQIP
ncbi:MAG: DUF6056 family protein [Lachnospiraceae bacterium]|nr:DUF6056 family protein [Lachnospiraceae bacterium]